MLSSLCLAAAWQPTAAADGGCAAAAHGRQCRLCLSHSALQLRWQRSPAHRLRPAAAWLLPLLLSGLCRRLQAILLRLWLRLRLRLLALSAAALLLLNPSHSSLHLLPPQVQLCSNQPLRV